MDHVPSIAALNLPVDLCMRDLKVVFKRGGMDIKVLRDKPLSMHWELGLVASQNEDVRIWQFG
jgi:hypothetical protein